jgi:Tfp pilus assembly protein PilE
MSVIQLMVTIIIVTILVTVILGVISYAAYWLRRMRRPTKPVEVDTTPRFFYRYLPDSD